MAQSLVCFAFTALFLLVACASDGDAQPTPPTSAPNSNGMSTAVNYPGQASLGSYGGTIGIKNEVNVNFPPNSLPGDCQLSIAPNTLPDPDLAYGDTANLFLPVQRGRYFYTITSSCGQPLANPLVTFTIPDYITQNATTSEQGRLMYFNLLEDEGETLEGVEVTNVRLFPVDFDATIMANLPLFAFYQASQAVTADPETFPPNLYFAHILIFTSATGPTASIGAPGSGRRLLELLGLQHDSLDLPARKLLQNAGAPPAVGTPGGSGGPSGPGGQGQPCAGQSGLVYPVSRDYTVEDPFGPRPDGKSFHDGVDIDPVPEGSAVFAAHAGTLDIHSSRQGLNGGYGYFIILTGEAGSTLYGHLTPNSATLPQGGNATAGQVIARSGLSGAVDSPLLHFTYVPNGRIYQSATAVDPVPCFAP